MNEQKRALDQARQYLERENLKWPTHLVQVPKGAWPAPMQGDSRAPVQVWRSRGFLVQVFRTEPEDFPALYRLSVMRTAISKDSKAPTASGMPWQDEITWDDLQRLKGECGFAHSDAVEVYPAQQDVVHVANMRHLWVIAGGLPFTWRDAPHGVGKPQWATWPATPALQPAPAIITHEAHQEGMDLARFQELVDRVQNLGLPVAIHCQGGGVVMLIDRGEYEMLREMARQTT